MTQALPISVIGIACHDSRVLVVRRSEHVIAPGLVCFPGGGLEEGEEEPAGVQREFREELGLNVIPQRCVWQSIAPWQVDLRWWLVDLPSEVTFRPNPREVAAFWWEEVEELALRADLLESNRYFLSALFAGEFSLAGGIS